MGLLKGSLDSGNKFTVNDSVRGLELIAVSTQPSFHVLETGDNVKWYMWINDSDEWIMHTSAPTASNRNSVGNIITGAGNSGANKTLSNLGTVSLTAILTPAASTTTDIGTSSKYFNDSYLGGKLYLSSSVTLDAGASARLDIIGDILLGVDAAGQYMTFYSTDTGGYMKWDADGASGAGSLTFTDDAQLIFGDGADLLMYWDAADFTIDPKTANYVVRSGDAANLDWVWESQSSDTNDMAWDASAATLHLAGVSKLHFGGNTVMTYDAGWSMVYDESETLNVEPYTTGQIFRIGETIVADFHLDGTSGYDVLWDASEDEYLFNDNAKLVFGGTSDDAVIYSDGTLLQIKLSGGGTTSGVVLDTYAAQTTAALHINGAANDWDGADGVGMLHISQDAALIHANAGMLAVVNSGKPINSATGFVARFVDTGTNVTTDPAYAVLIQSDNNFGLNIVTAAAAVSNLTMSGVAAQTSAMLNIVGTTGAGWDGASGVGMVNIAGDGAHADAAASLLNIVDGSGASIASGRGTSLRIVDTTTVGADSFVAYISTTANDGLLIDTGHADGINLKLTGLQAQVAPMMLIDASTGTGWDGADNVGALLIDSDSVLVANGASLLRVQSSATQKAGSEGALARFENTGTAQPDAVMVEIIAKDSTEVALNVGSGVSKFAHGSQFGAIARAATVAGATTGTVGDGESFITVTASDTNAIIILPAPTPGNVVWLASPTDDSYELRTSAPNTVYLNGGNGTSAESAIANADSLTRCVCVDATHWTVSNFALDGEESKADASAN